MIPLRLVSFRAKRANDYDQGNDGRSISHLRFIAFEVLNTQLGIFDRSLKLIIRFDQFFTLPGDGLITLFTVILRSWKTKTGVR